MKTLLRIIITTIISGAYFYYLGVNEVVLQEQILCDARINGITEKHADDTRVLREMVKCSLRCNQVDPVIECFTSCYK